MSNQSLDNKLEAYSKWRKKLSSSIQDMKDWLMDENITDLRSHNQIERVLGTLADDNLSVAFVAEFSRGKTELINTIFFGHHKKRILPSGSGRTTMCPTEILYDPSQPVCVRLLPIETRKDERPLHELKADQDLWEEITLDPDNAKSTAKALEHMTDVKFVSVDEAEALELHATDDDAHGYGMHMNEDGEVEIPMWRHAVINLPHPLLEQGLVVLDTPGLNAIGAEPELTINQLSTAHAVVFILASDTGVTKTDLTLWEDHIKMDSDEGNKSRLIALNKIDTLWDELRSKEEIEGEIEKQINTTAKTLGVDKDNIFPVSAQKGLLGKVKNNDEILFQSNIIEFESAIANNLIPTKQNIVINNINADVNGIIDSATQILNKRLNDVDEHSAELRQLSSKNTDVIEHIMHKVQSEKESLENHMQRFQAIRTVFTKHTTKLLGHLSQENFETLVAETKRDLASGTATTLQIQKSISNFFNQIQRNIDNANKQALEILALSESVNNEFEEEHGLGKISPRKLRLANYKQRINRLEQKHAHLKKSRSLFFKEQMSITQRFYDSVVTATRKIFKRAVKDASDWSKGLMVPLESQVREHHTQLRRRLESVKRIHKASDTVEDRLKELDAVRDQILQQQQILNSHVKAIFDALKDKNATDAEEDELVITLLENNVIDIGSVEK